jgi:hypothetical protein
MKIKVFHTNTLASDTYNKIVDWTITEDGQLYLWNSEFGSKSEILVAIYAAMEWHHVEVVNQEQ